MMVGGYGTSVKRDCKIDMSLNINPLGCSDKVLEVLKDTKSSEITDYPRINDSLIEAIAKYEGVNPENIAVCAGSDRCLEMIFSTFAEDISSVSFPVPSFPRYRSYMESNNLKYSCLDVSPFGKRSSEMFFSPASWLLIDSPGNPSGQIMKVDELCSLKKKYDFTVIDSALDDRKVPAELAGEDCFVVRSFSKLFGIAGMRIGYILSSESNIDKINRYLSPFEVTSLSQKAAKAALKDLTHVEKTREFIESEMRWMKTELSELGIQYSDSRSMNMVLKLDSDTQNKLFERGVNFVKGSEYPDLPDNCLRISLRSKKDNKRFIGFLKAVV